MNEIINCPKCNIQMAQGTRGGVIIDLCQICNGMYFDYQELGGTLDTMQHTLDNLKSIDRGDFASDHREVYKCPMCKVYMQERVYSGDSGVHIDVCTECGSIFLDEKEVQEIKNYSDSTEITEEGIVMNKKALKISKEIDKKQDETLTKIRKNVDDLFWSDDIIGVDKVVDFILKRIM